MTTDKKDKRKRIKSYSKYSGMVYQLFGMLAITIFLGLKADAYFGYEKRYITAVALIVVLFSFFYKLTIDLSKK